MDLEDFMASPYNKKRKFASRILQKDNILYEIDTSQKFSPVSVIVPSVTHYWIMQIQKAKGQNLTPLQYFELTKKLDKFFYRKLDFSFIASMLNGNKHITGEFSTARTNDMFYILDEYVDVYSIRDCPKTVYKFRRGSIVLQNLYDNNADEYSVYTDRRANAKSYRVDMNAESCRFAENLMFASEKDEAHSIPRVRGCLDA